MVKRTLRGILIGMVALLAAGATHATQFSGAAAISRQSVDSLPGLGAGRDEDNGPYASREMQAHQQKLLRAAHQREVMADTARLLQLATQLKAETDTGVTASPHELKDVDEIAKLAKRLGERIKTE